MYVPFSQKSDHIEDRLIWRHHSFIDNVYEMLTDHLTTVIDSESDVKLTTVC
jgi:hypothetical protein